MVDKKKVLGVSNIFDVVERREKGVMEENV
jgi:hypothetical protein